MFLLAVRANDVAYFGENRYHALFIASVLAP
jgi:hypothetical protein